MSYAYNIFLNLFQLRLTQLPVSRIAVFFDGLPNGGGTLGGGWWLDDPDSNRGKNAKTISSRASEARHFGQMNVSFLDGHVEFLVEVPDTAVY